jgi:hypothetical protein
LVLDLPEIPITSILNAHDNTENFGCHGDLQLSNALALTPASKK